MHEKLDKIKEHIKAHRNEYIIGGVLVVVTGAVGYAIGRKGFYYSADSTYNFRAENQNISVGATIIGNGHPGKDLLIMKGGEIIKRCASQNEAAEFLGVTAKTVARHLNGDQEHVRGNTVIELGRAA